MVGVHYDTAYHWWRNGLLPVPAEQLPSGTIIVHAEPAVSGDCVVYARVSSRDQAESLDLQVARVTRWATENGHRVDRVVTEVGSALNGNRVKFKRLLSDSSAATIVVEHRDRLACFGSECVESALAAQGRRVVVVDSAEVEDDLVRDMTEVLTLLCVRVYGRRGAKARAAAAMQGAENAQV